MKVNIMFCMRGTTAHFVIKNIRLEPSLLIIIMQNASSFFLFFSLFLMMQKSISFK
jgi:hypothetical protein